MIKFQAVKKKWKDFEAGEFIETKSYGLALIIKKKYTRIHHHFNGFVYQGISSTRLNDIWYASSMYEKDIIEIRKGFILKK
jgi:hypothetical protein